MPATLDALEPMTTQTDSRIVTVRLRSTAPISFSKMVDPGLKQKSETHNDFEERTWRLKAPTNDDGNIIIRKRQFTCAIQDAAKLLSIQIPGKGKSTYTKHFKTTRVLDDIDTGVPQEEVEGSWINANSDGVRGSGKRVQRCFPTVRNWEGEIRVLVGDPVITKDVFAQVLASAGFDIGIGQYRPQNCGEYGTFEVQSIEW